MSSINQDFDLEALTSQEKDICYAIYELSEKKCLEKFPYAKICMDVTNDKIDYSACKRAIKDIENCVKQDSRSKLVERGYYTPKK